MQSSGLSPLVEGENRGLSVILYQPFFTLSPESHQGPSHWINSDVLEDAQFYFKMLASLKELNLCDGSHANSSMPGLKLYSWQL